MSAPHVLAGALVIWLSLLMVVTAVRMHMTRLVDKREAASAVARHPASRRLNEAELLSPIEDMVAAIERRMEHEAGQCGPDCRQCSLDRCPDCERVAIFAMGIEKPIQTVVTDPCPRHQVR